MLPHDNASDDSNPTDKVSFDIATRQNSEATKPERGKTWHYCNCMYCTVYILPTQPNCWNYYRKHQNRGEVNINKSPPIYKNLWSSKGIHPKLIWISSDCPCNLDTFILFRKQRERGEVHLSLTLSTEKGGRYTCTIQSSRCLFYISVSHIEEGLRQKKRQRSSILFGGGRILFNSLRR